MNIHFHLTTVVKAIMESIDKAGFVINDIDKFLIHPAISAWKYVIPL